MYMETRASQFAKALSTDSADTSFPSRIPTATEPSGSGVLDIGMHGVSSNGMILVPYATSGDGDTFSMRVIGWRVVGAGNTDTLLWIPVVLAEIACTASTTVGVAGKIIVATERFVDTITLVTGNDDISIDIVSPTGDEIAHVLVDTKGFQKIELTFDSTAVGTTAMNCLYAPL